MNCILKFLSLGFMCLTQGACLHKNTKSKLVGTWKLESMNVVTDQKSSPFKGGMDGYLVYHPNGWVALQLTPKNYANQGLAFKNFDSSAPLAQLKHIANNYNYIGKYTILKDTVMHIKMMHSNPNEWGDTSYRHFFLIHDSLYMRPLEQKNKTLNLKWVKQN